MRYWLRRGFTVGILRRSLGVALIVGTILNLINQGDALFGSVRLNLLKMLLTYSVPFCVSTYGAVAYRLSAEGTDGLSSSAEATEPRGARE
jgi:hypothetical protein